MMKREEELKRLLELKKIPARDRSYPEQQQLNKLNKKYGTSQVNAKEFEAILQKDPSLKKSIAEHLQKDMKPGPSSMPVPRPGRHLKKHREPELTPEAPRPRPKPTPFG